MLKARVRLRVGYVFQLVGLVFIGSFGLAQELIVSAPEAPMYQLSDIRTTIDRFGRPGVEFSYTRTREGTGAISIGVRGPNGETQVVGGSLPNPQSGTIALSSFFGGVGNSSINLEVYFTTSVTWAETVSRQCLISNSVRIGSVSGSVSARQWNSQEQAAYEKHKLGSKPPASLPPQHVAVDQYTKLRPGVPVMLGRYGEWLEAELVSTTGNEAVVNLRGTVRNIRTTKDGWLAISKDTINRLQENPDQFSTKIRVTPLGSLSVPDDAVPLPDSIELVEGMPVLIEHRAAWLEAFVTSTTGIHLASNEGSVMSTWPYKRGDLAVKTSTLEKLKDPQAVAEFAKIAEAQKKKSGGSVTGASRRTCDYPIQIALPARTRKLPEKLLLEKDTVLYACWGTKWYEVYALDDYGDGTILIHWKDWPSESWDCIIKREQLIIEEKTIALLGKSRKPKLGQDSEESDGSEDAGAVRTWADRSGAFKVEAALVRKSSDEVVLKTEAGKELKVKIEKLSDADKAFLKSLPAEAENPFAE